MLCFSFHSSSDRWLELAVFLAKTIQQVIRTFLQLSSCQTHFLHESVDRTPIMIRFPVAYSIHSWISGLPRCKNLTRFSLLVSFCFAVRYCLKCFCFLCFTSSVSFTGSYTEVKPEFRPRTPPPSGYFSNSEEMSKFLYKYRPNVKYSCNINDSKASY